MVLAELITVAPDLRARHKDLASNPALDPQAEQLRLFKSVVSLCAALSERAPLLLTVEDVHWADGGTLSLLRHLARRARHLRLLMVLTYREAELSQAQGLRDLLLHLMRQREVTQIKLAHFSPEQTRELLAVMLGEEVSPEFLDGLYRVTEGNPFFVEEVCKTLVEEGSLERSVGRWRRPRMEELHIPQKVRLAIQSRVGRLPDQVQEVLRLAAIIGQEFGLDILQRVSQLDERAVMDALEIAERAQLISVVEIPDRGWGGEVRLAFAQALITSALREGLTGLHRRRLHRRVVQAMEAVRPEEVEALAYHCRRGGDRDGERRYARLAGERAAARYANDEALNYFQRALEGSEAGEEYDRILGRRAKLLLGLFRGHEAAEDYERLLERAKDAGDRSSELDALLGLARANYVVALDAEQPDFALRSRELYEEAYQLARELGEKPSMVRALIPTGWFIDFWPEYYDQAAANARQAAALGQEVGDEELIIVTNMAMLSFVSLLEREALAEELAKHLEQRRDLLRLKEVYFGLMWTHLQRGNFGRCVECCDAGIRLAAEVGVPPVQYPTLKGLALLGLGRYDAARECLGREVADEAHRLGSAFKDYGMGVYFLELMAYEKASKLFESVAEQARHIGRAWLRCGAQVHLARSLIRAGQLDEAKLETISQDLATMGGTLPPDVTAEIAFSAGRLGEALEQAQKASSEAEEKARRPDHIAALELQLRVLLRLDRPRDVVALADEGIRMAEEVSYLPMVWRIRAAKARALEMLGEDDAVAQEYEAAAAVLRELAHSIGNAELKQGFMSNPLVSPIIVASKRHTGEEE